MNDDSQTTHKTWDDGERFRCSCGWSSIFMESEEDRTAAVAQKKQHDTINKNKTTELNVILKNGQILKLPFSAKTDDDLVEIITAASDLIILRAEPEIPFDGGIEGEFVWIQSNYDDLITYIRFADVSAIIRESAEKIWYGDCRDR
jgi:hypothetical protein